MEVTYSGRQIYCRGCLDANKKVVDRCAVGQFLLYSVFFVDRSCTVGFGPVCWNCCLNKTMCICLEVRNSHAVKTNVNVVVHYWDNDVQNAQFKPLLFRKHQRITPCPNRKRQKYWVMSYFSEIINVQDKKLRPRVRARTGVCKSKTTGVCVMF